MALQKIKKKFHKTRVLSSGAELSFRPFTVGELKQAVIASQSKRSDADTYRVTATILQDCVEGVVIEDLYLVDLQKLFYDIRAISDASFITVRLACKSPTCKTPDGKPTEFQVDLTPTTDFVLRNGKGFTKEIQLDSDAGPVIARFRQPSIKKIIAVESMGYSQGREARANLESKYGKDAQVYSDEIRKLFETADSQIARDDLEKMFSLMGASLQEVAVGQQVDTEFTLVEACEWIADLPGEVLSELIEFFKSSPRFGMDKTLACPTCGFANKLADEEVAGFF